MSNKSVFCFSTSRDQAAGIVEQLKTGFFANNDISVLFPDKRTTHDFAREMNTKALKGAIAGEGSGGGGALGWIAGIGAFAFSEPGPFIGPGPNRKEGNILISVHTENPSEISRVEDIFTRFGAQDICTLSECGSLERSDV